MGWKKTEFMWENVKNFQNHFVGQRFHNEAKPWETLHCAVCVCNAKRSKCNFKRGKFAIQICHRELNEQLLLNCTKIKVHKRNFSLWIQELSLSTTTSFTLCAQESKKVRVDLSKRAHKEPWMPLQMFKSHKNKSGSALMISLKLSCATYPLT